VKVGFIGFGNMGFALGNGITKKEDFGQVYFYDPYISSDKYDKKKFIKVSSIKNLSEKSKVIFLAVKPNIYEDTLIKIKEFLGDEHILISIVAGKDENSIKSVVGKDVKTIIAMPNTPALIGSGVTCFYASKEVSETEIFFILELFKLVGDVYQIKKSLMDMIASISGSSPAYVYMLIQAMGTGAIMQGMSSDIAYKIAAQAVLGSARMILESNEHPAILRDRVCSPGGSTILAVRKLEEKGFSSAILAAMEECTRKIKKMKKGEYDVRKRKN